MNDMGRRREFPPPRYIDAPQVYASTGTTGATTSQTYVAGVLASEIATFAAGSSSLSETKSYTKGVLTRDTIVHADGSKDVFIYNVENQSYVSEHDSYNAAGILTSTVRTHTDDTLAFSYTIAPNGTKTTDFYDASGNLTSDSIVRADSFSETKTYAAGVITGDTIRYAPGGTDISDAKVYTAGILTSDTVVHADKSRDLYLSNIQNKTYVAEHDSYNAAGILTSTVRAHTDGSLDYS